MNMHARGCVDVCITYLSYCGNKTPDRTLSGGKACISLLSQMVELKHIEGGATRQSSWPWWLPYVLPDQKA